MTYCRHELLAGTCVTCRDGAWVAGNARPRAAVDASRAREPWTAREDAAVAAGRARPLAELAAALGRSVDAVECRRRLLG